jgi:eukaryotic-like serine/threonine-protein kinase
LKSFFAKLVGNKTPLQRRESIRRIGEYSVVREIGAGVTSNVYLGLHVTSMKAAAVKQLSLKYSSPSHRQMFATEASLCGQMDHPNIVDLYGADLDAPGGPYLVMEYVDGNSLDKFDSPETLLPIETVIDIMRQSAEALRYAATLGIVHRDVKPGNIIVRKDGRVKIADFGCAIIRNTNGQQLGIAGSLPYMSPEQIEGKLLTHQSDIYSLGAVFYRLLTGHYAHPMEAGQTAQIYARKILSNSHTSIETYRQGVPPDIAKFVDRALRKNLEERHGSWDEFLGDLHRASTAGYAGDERLNTNWQSFEIRQRQRITPRTYDWSFSM